MQINLCRSQSSNGRWDAIYENNVGVLTNNPPFNIQMFLLNQYMNLSPKQPENLFAKDIDLDQYSRGMGAIGLPGDLSSSSRFAKCSIYQIAFCLWRF